MAEQCNVVVLEEAHLLRPDGWALCFQWCRYIYADKSVEYGYRFIWRWPGGKLQAARGQARIPSIDLMNRLIAKARQEGWAEKSSGDVSDSFAG